jgi:putative endonuclease
MAAMAPMAPMAERSRSRRSRRAKKKKMTGYTYILECASGSFYTGSTIDLERRIWQHQNGEGANHTKKYLPVKLVYFETYKRIDEAFYREKQIQGWGRKKKIALINSMTEELKKLAECMNETHYMNRK